MCAGTSRSFAARRQILVVASQMLKFHFVGLLCLAHYARAGENYILQKGPVLRSDQRRLSKRLYPHNNATADSLQQYKKDVPNGNDYNLVGDNVGDLPSIFFRRNHSSLSVARSSLLQMLSTKRYCSLVVPYKKVWGRRIRQMLSTC